MAAFKPSRILIFGGTGQIGQYITASILRAQPAFGQVTLFTSPATVANKAPLLDAWKKRGLSVITGDVTSATDLAAAFHNHDTVISAVGRGVLDNQLEMLRLADGSGTVKWFFPSEYGTDIEHNEKSPTEKPHQMKLKVRKYVREHVKNLKVTYVVTGPYFDMWLNTMSGMENAGGYDLDRKHAFVIDEGDGKVGFCTMWDVGKAVVAALQHPEESFDKALRIQSFVVTPNEVLAELEKQTDSKWTVTKTPLDHIREFEAKLWAMRYPFATGVTLRRIWAEGGTLYDKNDNDLVGLVEGESLETLEQGVRKALSTGWRHDDLA